MLDNLTVSYIKEIQEASQQNRLVAFVGAGASCDAGVPLWNDLVGLMAKVLPQDIRDKYDNLQLAQFVRETCDEKAYYSNVRKHLLQNITCPNAIHDAILELNPNCIITTNYDTLLEEAALRKNQQFWVVGKDSDMPQNHGERLLVKMHGDLDNENIVLTENDYYDYSRNFPLIRSFVVSQFVSKVVVFIGFSFSDINLRYILREVQCELGTKMQKAFLLTQEMPSPVEMNDFKERGVNVLSITSDSAQNIIHKLKLEPRPDHFLSERGRTLVYQLGILKDFRESCQLIDLFVDFFENQVDGLNVSGHYLKYAFPKDKRKGFYYKGRNLNLPDQYVDEFNKLFESKHSIRLLSDKYGNKLQKLRLQLLDCDVNTINYKTINSKCSSRKRSNMAPPSAVQSYYDMDIDTLMGRIKILRERTLAYNMEDLELPYVLFQAGYYYDAYEIYSMLAPEMWKRRKYALFFICIYNMHTIAWPAIRSIQGRKDMDCESIKRTYYSCDLTKELNRLPLTECSNALFSDLIYQHQLSDALIITSNTTGKIAQQRKRAEDKTGWSMNSNIKKVFINFIYFFDFCIDNYLVTDNNDIGSQFYVTVARGIFDSVLTPSDGFQSKLKAIDVLSLYVVLFKLSSKELKELISDVVGNKKMPITDDSLKKLRQYVENIHKVAINVSNRDNLPIKEHILMNWLQNIILIVPHIENVPEIKHLDIVIAHLWNRASLTDRIIEITEYFLSNRPTAEAAELLLYEALESVNHDYKIIDMIMAISESTQNSKIKWNERRLIKGVEFQGSARVAAAVLRATGNCLKVDLIKFIEDNAKSLLDIVSAQNLSSERLLTEESFNKHKSNLTDFDNSIDRYNLIVQLVDLYKTSNDNYADIKECISSLAEKMPVLKFALNPLAWPDFSTIDFNWMRYVSEDLYDDIIKNEMAKNKLKEYCDKVSWGREIKEILWKKW